MSAVRVLVADDDADLCALVAEVLGRAGLAVEKAADGSAALAAAGRLSPELVVLDVAMPGLDGVQVCSRVKTDAATAATRVLLISSDDRDEVIGAGYAAGADDFLIKPFSNRELQRRVRLLLTPCPSVPTEAS